MDNREPSVSNDEPTGATPRGGYGNTEYGSTTGVRSGSMPTGGRSGGTGDQVRRQTAAPVADQVQQTAGQVADRAQDMATTQANTQLDRAADTVGSVAHAMKQVSQQLRKDNQEQVAGVADLAAGRLNDVAGYLRQQDVGRLIDDVQGVARRQPVLFLGGAFVLGFIGARFLKSSGPSPDGMSGNYGGGRGNYQPPMYYGRAGYAPGRYGTPPTRGTGVRTTGSGTGSRGYGTPGWTPDTEGYETGRVAGAGSIEDAGTRGTRYGGRGYDTSGGASGYGRSRDTRGTGEYGAGSGTGETPRTGV